MVGGPSPNIRMANESLTEQAYNIVYEENNKELEEDSSGAKYEYTIEDNVDY